MTQATLIVIAVLALGYALGLVVGRRRPQEGAQRTTLTIRAKRHGGRNDRLLWGILAGQRPQGGDGEDEASAAQGRVAGCAQMSAV
jgi:hypothetical protein